MKIIAHMAVLVVLSTASPLTVSAQSDIAANPTTQLEIAQCIDARAPGQLPVTVDMAAEGVVEPGSPVTFSGTVANDAHIVLSDVAIYATVYWQSESGALQQVGTIKVTDDVTLARGEMMDVSATWDVPTQATSGTYSVLFYVLSGDAYISGLPYSQGVTAGMMDFTVSGGPATNTSPYFIPEQSVIEEVWIENSLGQAVPMNQYDFSAATLPTTERATTTTFQVTLMNPTSENKSLPIQWKQYTGHVFSDENIRDSQTQLVTVPAERTVRVIYDAPELNESQMLVTAEAFYGDTASIITMGVDRPSQQLEIDIHAAGLSDMPLVAGADYQVSLCANTVLQQKPVDPLLVTVALTNRAGEPLHRYEARYPLLNQPLVFSDVFTAATDEEYVVLEAVVSDSDARVLASVRREYDCAAMGAACDDGGDDWFASNALPISIVVGGVVLLLIALRLMQQRRRRTTISSGLSN